MLSRPLLIAILASPFFVPVSCTSAMLPVAHGLSWLQSRDVAGGEPLQRSPVPIPLVDPASPSLATFVTSDELPAALRRWPSLTPRLPEDGNTAGPGKDRLYWRVLGDGAGGRLIELRHENAAFDHTVRYRATDDGVAFVSSRLFADVHGRWGFAAGLAFSALFWAAMRRLRRRPAATPPR